MQITLFLLLVSFGALLMVSIFQFTIYLQQKDKAFLYYSAYLFVMSAFIAVRILDERLSNIYPLSPYAIETLDPLLSNTAFLMYINFLGVVLKINRSEKVYYTSWRVLKIFIPLVLIAYFLFQFFEINPGVSNALITICSFAIIGFGAILAFRLFVYVNEIFFRLIIIGTVVAVIGVLAGLLINFFVYNDKLAFGGLYFLLPAMMIEAVFLSAALGYRLKLAYMEKDQAQQKLINETIRNEQLALQTASLLQKELNVQQLQKRISQDLHDEVGSALSGIALYSFLTKSQMQNNETDKVNTSLEVIETSAANMVTKLNDIVWAINPGYDDLSDLLQRLQEYALQMTAVKNIEFSFEGLAVMQGLKLPMTHRKNLYLIFKEAINNAIKYSGCTRIQLQVARQNHHIEICLTDNGKGFNIEKQKQGDGLANIQQRAVEMEATKSLRSTSDGTRLRLDFKIPEIII